MENMTKVIQEPKVQDILDKIDHVAHSLGIYVFAVGGFCRNLLMGKPHPPDNDIDFMADEYGGLKLAGMLASNFKSPIQFYHRTGTAQIEHNGVNLEFQAFRPKYEILEEMRKMNVPQNILYLNVFSRDFTINSILYGLRTNKIYDLTEMGIDDLKMGLLRTPIVSDVAVKVDPIIILRAIMFKNRYDFQIDEELDIAMRKYSDTIMNNISKERFNIAIDKILSPNKKKGLKLLKNYNIDIIDYLR